MQISVHVPRKVSFHEQKILIGRKCEHILSQAFGCIKSDFVFLQYNQFGHTDEIILFNLHNCTLGDYWLFRKAS